MNDTNYRVSLAFAKYSALDLKGFASGVIISLTDNPAFPDLPVSIADLTALQEAFAQSLFGQVNGGQLATALKNQAQANLVTALRDEAAYVQIQARFDVVALLTSGFAPTNTNSTPSQLPQPLIAQIDHGVMMGQLILRVNRVPNAKSYQARYHNGDGVWQDAGFFTQGRRIEVAGLTPGVVYYFSVRVLGGSTGQSAWSDVRSQRSL